MRESVKALFEGVIDYAGLFPPATLHMPQAVAEYLNYRNGRESWIINRFVCPASRLDELADNLERRKPDDLVEVTAIASPTNDPGAWDDALADDSEAMNGFNQRMDGIAEVLGYEIKLPDTENLGRYLRDLSGFEEADVFLELPHSATFSDAIAEIADTEWACAKLRTGGIEPDACPSPAMLADFIHECISLDVPFKLTAGLHHAFPSPGMHGFVNVLAAAALVYCEDAARTVAAGALSETENASFVFENTALTWRGHTASLECISEMRDLFVGFGSCSVKEPIDDLARAGLVGR